MLKGSQIVRVRKALGMTIAELAQILHVHAVTLNRWELAKRPKVEGLCSSLLPVLIDKLPRIPAAVFTIDGTRARKSLAVGGSLHALEILVRLALQSPPAFPPTQTATGGTPMAATSPASKPRRARAS